MDLIEKILFKSGVLKWLYANAHAKNLIFFHHPDIRERTDRINAFSSLPEKERKEKEKRLLSGLDEKSRKNAEDFIRRIKFWTELMKYEFILSVRPNDSNEEESSLHREYLKLKTGEHLFSAPEISSRTLCHGLRSANQKIQAYVSGKVFIDAGAWEGDSTLSFIENFHPEKVFAFEISRKNAEKYLRNMKRLAISADRYELILKGLGAKHEFLEFNDIGGCGCSVKSDGRDKAEIIRLDDFLKERKSPVGFIKADVEGAGLDMALGMTETLRRDRPVLSLSIYHSPGEFYEIKPFLEDLGLNYKFEIKKCSPLIDLNDFVLFAYPAELE